LARPRPPPKCQLEAKVSTGKRMALTLPGDGRAVWGRSYKKPSSQRWPWSGDHSGTATASAWRPVAVPLQIKTLGTSAIKKHEPRCAQSQLASEGQKKEHEPRGLELSENPRETEDVVGGASSEAAQVPPGDADVEGASWNPYSQELPPELKVEPEAAEKHVATDAEASPPEATASEASSSCPAGHAMEPFVVQLKSLCCSCHQEFTEGSAMHGCPVCDFDVCEACQNCRKAGQRLLSLVKAPLLTDTAAAGAEDVQLQADQVWWWWPQVQHWAWAMDTSASAVDVCQQKTPTTVSIQLEGDETLEGPDGDMYEIFYPAMGDPDEKEEVSTACSESHTPRTETVSEGWSPVESPPYPVFTCRRTSAEDGIADVVEFMRTAAVARYPARARFFELVQETAAEALGPHFERLALVGSTALKIDTPDSDLDAVAFTRSILVEESQPEGAPHQVLMAPPTPVESLRRIARVLGARDPSLKLQLVDCSRVPVLTAVSADGLLSLDLTVDQPLGEWHVLWFQNLWQAEPFAMRGPLHNVPAPIPLHSAGLADGLQSWELGLEAAALRCVKWWLRRRRIPVSKEGGYPTVVWTLMVLHVLRCSLLINDAALDKSRALLGAIAAFFDKFSECRCSGTLLFSYGPDGMRSEFHPLEAADYGELSVLDPTTTCEESAAWGIEPLDLAPALPHATRLLHAYELQRAQRHSAAALAAASRPSEGPVPVPCGEVVVAPSAASGGLALQELFAEIGEAQNTLPTVLPAERTGVLLLRDGVLHLGILKKIDCKPGWCAPFLHRRDMHSAIAVELCNVDRDTGVLTPRKSLVAEHWFHPSDFVCMAELKTVASHVLGRQRRRPVPWPSEDLLKLDKEALERWRGMRALVTVDVKPSASRHGRNRRTGAGKYPRA